MEGYPDDETLSKMTKVEYKELKPYQEIEDKHTLKLDIDVATIEELEEDLQTLKREILESENVRNLAETSTSLKENLNKLPMQHWEINPVKLYSNVETSESIRKEKIKPGIVYLYVESEIMYNVLCGKLPNGGILYNRVREVHYKMYPELKPRRIIRDLLGLSKKEIGDENTTYEFLTQLTKDKISQLSREEREAYDNEYSRLLDRADLYDRVREDDDMKDAYDYMKGDIRFFVDTERSFDDIQTVKDLFKRLYNLSKIYYQIEAGIVQIPLPPKYDPETGFAIKKVVDPTRLICAAAYPWVDKPRHVEYIKSIFEKFSTNNDVMAVVKNGIIENVRKYPSVQMLPVKVYNKKTDETEERVKIIVQFSTEARYVTDAGFASKLAHKIKGFVNDRGDIHKEPHYLTGQIVEAELLFGFEYKYLGAKPKKVSTGNKWERKGPYEPTAGSKSAWANKGFKSGERTSVPMRGRSVSPYSARSTSPYSARSSSPYSQERSQSPSVKPAENPWTRNTQRASTPSERSSTPTRLSTRGWSTNPVSYIGEPGSSRSSTPNGLPPSGSSRSSTPNRLPPSGSGEVKSRSTTPNQTRGSENVWKRSVTPSRLPPQGSSEMRERPVTPVENVWKTRTLTPSRLPPMGSEVMKERAVTPQAKPSENYWKRTTTPTSLPPRGDSNLKERPTSLPPRGDSNLKERPTSVQRGSRVESSSSSGTTSRMRPSSPSVPRVESRFAGQSSSLRPTSPSVSKLPPRGDSRLKERSSSPHELRKPTPRERLTGQSPSSQRPVTPGKQLVYKETTREPHKEIKKVSETKPVTKELTFSAAVGAPVRSPSPPPVESPKRVIGSIRRPAVSAKTGVRTLRAPPKVTESQPAVQSKSEPIVQSNAEPVVQEPKRIVRTIPQKVETKVENKVENKAPSRIIRQSVPVESPKSNVPITRPIVRPSALKPESPKVVRPESPKVVRPESPKVVRPESPKVVRPESPKVVRPESPKVVRPESPKVVKPESAKIVRNVPRLIPKEPSPVVKPVPVKAEIASPVLRAPVPRLIPRERPSSPNGIRRIRGESPTRTSRSSSPVAVMSEQAPSPRIVRSIGRNLGNSESNFSALPEYKPTEVEYEQSASGRPTRYIRKPTMISK